jgi:hypothetical protein
MRFVVDHVACWYVNQPNPVPKYTPKAPRCEGKTRDHASVRQNVPQVDRRSFPSHTVRIDTSPQNRTVELRGAKADAWLCTFARSDH